VRFRLGASSFYQINPEQTEVLYRTALDGVGLDGTQTVVDAYCGVGTIGLTLANRCRRLIGVEVVPQAVENARENARRNGIENAEFLCADAAGAATQLASQGVRPDVAIVDPPRKGCAPEVFAAIDKMGIERLVYVSCDPATLARDLALLATMGYTARRACGVDLSFTPVLDLDHGESGVIGDRAFARDPRVVALLAKSLMHGLLQAGMANCGKHFPGHGFVKADSHTEVPVDKRSLKAILADDAAPYPWLSTTLTSVMPAHVIYPKVDSRPAGFSQRWLQEILRRQMRFDGAIFSDDLSMEGARRIDGQVVSYTDAALAALEAGCDLVLLCNQSLGEGKAVDELIDGLAAVLAKGRWLPNVDSESRRLALLPETLPQPWDELMLQPAYMQALDLLP
jgi:precorrin-6B methylase 2